MRGAVVPRLAGEVSAFHREQEQLALAILVHADGRNVDTGLCRAALRSGIDVVAKLAEQVRQDRIELFALAQGCQVAAEDQLHAGFSTMHMRRR